MRPFKLEVIRFQMRTHLKMMMSKHRRLMTILCKVKTSSEKKQTNLWLLNLETAKADNTDYLKIKTRWFLTMLLVHLKSNCIHLDGGAQRIFFQTNRCLKQDKVKSNKELHLQCLALI